MACLYVTCHTTKSKLFRHLHKLHVHNSPMLATRILVCSFPTDCHRRLLIKRHWSLGRSGCVVSAGSPTDSAAMALIYLQSDLAGRLRCLPNTFCRYVLWRIAEGVRGT